MSGGGCSAVPLVLVAPDDDEAPAADIISTVRLTVVPSGTVLSLQW